MVSLDGTMSEGNLKTVATDCTIIRGVPILTLRDGFMCLLPTPSNYHMNRGPANQGGGRYVYYDFICSKSVSCQYYVLEAS
ncbi:hypothetical protein TNCV_4588841 [Trichonephila clavipes]|nr:hypothetical protein TNCV_4588841 [Trichonephila clavipes]